MDVLQTCGVSASDSANDCAKEIKDKPMKTSQDGDVYKPTFFEVYGQGKHCASITWMISHCCKTNAHVPWQNIQDQTLRRVKSKGLRKTRPGFDFYEEDEYREDCVCGVLV